MKCKRIDERLEVNERLTIKGMKIIDEENSSIRVVDDYYYLDGKEVANYSKSPKSKKSIIAFNKDRKVTDKDKKMIIKVAKEKYMISDIEVTEYFNV